MRRPTHVKPAALAPARKAALSAAAAARRSFPAWIDASDGAAFSATAVTPRVRDALVLRTVSRKKTVSPRSAAHAAGAR